MDGESTILLWETLRATAINSLIQGGTARPSTPFEAGSNQPTRFRYSGTEWRQPLSNQKLPYGATHQLHSGTGPSHRTSTTLLNCVYDQSPAGSYLSAPSAGLTTHQRLNDKPLPVLHPCSLSERLGFYLTTRNNWEHLIPGQGFFPGTGRLLLLQHLMTHHLHLSLGLSGLPGYQP